MVAWQMLGHIGFTLLPLTARLKIYCRASRNKMIDNIVYRGYYVRTTEMLF